GPDVTSRFDTMTLSQEAPDRVRISGTKGERPPDTLKVSMNAWGGYRSDIVLALTGLDIEAKAELLETAFWTAAPIGPEAFESVTTTLVRTDHDDPTSNEAATAQWRLTVKDPDERKTKAISVGINDMALATIPGFYGLAGAGIGKPFGVHTSGLVPADLVPQHVAVLGGARTVVDSVAPPGGEPVAPPAVSLPPIPGGETRRAPLGTILGSRSGDKGGNANLGVFARSAEAYVWMADLLSVERLRELLPEAADLRIDRHDLPNLWSLNFLIHGILQEGVAASTRQDGQAKSLGEWLRARHVDIPVVLLEAT
ncbi:MAG: acyclic terpene utilization AtuA family protein, partial [Actinomycetota bacterium]